MMHFLLVLTLGLQLSFIDFDTLTKQAAQQNKKVLLVFSGSDWCRPCIEFDKAVLSKSEFSAYAEKEIIYYKADLPRKKKGLQKDVLLQNQQLAEKYNPEGSFPKLILIHPNGTVLKVKKGAFSDVQALKLWIED